MKSLREDSLAEIAEADLRALVEIVQSQQPDPPNLVEALSFGKEVDPHHPERPATREPLE
eukprot:1002381-Amorphochlora_amoeboformis.AAC.4